MIDNPDMVNAGFETVGALTQWLNVRRLHRDKEVKGVAWQFSAFFITWGLYNLRYYSYYGSWISFWAGMLMTMANMVWLSMAIYYGVHKKKDKTPNDQATHSVPWTEGMDPHDYPGGELHYYLSLLGGTDSDSRCREVTGASADGR